MHNVRESAYMHNVREWGAIQIRTRILLVHQSNINIHGNTLLGVIVLFALVGFLF